MVIIPGNWLGCVFFIILIPFIRSTIIAKDKLLVNY